VRCGGTLSRGFGSERHELNPYMFNAGIYNIFIYIYINI
jgi:hypothetical protein